MTYKLSVQITNAHVELLRTYVTQIGIFHYQVKTN